MKKVKVIKIDADKCNGCRACEAICSAFHATPKYSSTNPERSRIRVLFDPLKDIYVPVMAGEYTEAECNGRDIYTIDGKEDPDSGLPLKCDVCEEEPPLEEPMCVQWCLSDALTYEEREEEGEEEEKPGEMEIGLESLVKKHGYKKVKDTLAQIAKG
jgi:benzoyl-CoA reductase subunit BamC